jgi:hypothetical protein
MALGGPWVQATESPAIAARCRQAIPERFMSWRFVVRDLDTVPACPQMTETGLTHDDFAVVHWAMNVAGNLWCTALPRHFAHSATSTNGHCRHRCGDAYIGLSSGRNHSNPVTAVQKGIWC